MKTINESFIELCEFDLAKKIKMEHILKYSDVSSIKKVKLFFSYIFDLVKDEYNELYSSIKISKSKFSILSPTYTSEFKHSDIKKILNNSEILRFDKFVVDKNVIYNFMVIQFGDHILVYNKHSNIDYEEIIFISDFFK